MKGKDTCITEFLEYKRSESSQQSKTSASDNIPPALAGFEERCSVSCELISTEVLSGVGSFLAAFALPDWSGSFSEVNPDTAFSSEIKKLSEFIFIY